MSNPRISEEIDVAAAEWAVRVDCGPLSAEDQAALDAWLGDDTRRLGAFARARAMFVHAHRAKALGSHFDPDAAPAADWSQPKEIEVPSFIRPTRRQILLAGGCAAATAAIVTAFGLGSRASAQTYRTDRGQIRLIPMEDGSSVTLNTASEISVAFGRKQRAILLEEGEALFEVAKDLDRPFTVEASYANLRALGASFTVSRLEAKPVEILVRQGVVELHHLLARGTRPHLAVADTRTIMTPDGDIRTVALDSAELDRQLSWREGMLSFEDMPLEQAAAEFARYSNVKIRFGDAALAAETITGRFAANNPVGFCRTVALSMGVRAREKPGEVLLLRL